MKVSIKIALKFFQVWLARSQAARRFLDDAKPRYQAARTVYRDRKKLAEGIEWGELAVPPARASVEAHQQASLGLGFPGWMPQG